MRELLFVSFFCFVTLVVSSPVAITKCSASDWKCIKKSAQPLIPLFAAGIPEFGIETMDPLVIKGDVDASSQNLKLFVKDMVVTGLKGCSAKKIERDVQKGKMIVKLQCNVQAEGDYEMHGHLLILPIEGKGKSHVVLNKIVMTVENDMGEKVGKDGKKHWYVKGTKFSYELKDKAFVNFENLFNGNEILSRAANEVISTSANEIVMEIGPPVVKAIADKIVENVNRFYRAVPAEDLSLD